MDFDVGSFRGGIEFSINPYYGCVVNGIRASYKDVALFLSIIDKYTFPNYFTRLGGMPKCISDSVRERMVTNLEHIRNVIDHGAQYSEIIIAIKEILHNQLLAGIPIDKCDEETWMPLVDNASGVKQWINVVLTSMEGVNGGIPDS